MGEYSVVVRNSVYYNLRVEAYSPKEAEELALKRFADGEGKEVDTEVTIDGIALVQEE